MSEAPAKIWMAPDDAFAEYIHEFDGDIAYIRADLVDGLVEALEEVLAAERFSNRPPETTMQAEEKLERIKQAVLKAEAALKALEEA